MYPTDLSICCCPQGVQITPSIPFFPVLGVLGFFEPLKKIIISLMAVRYYRYMAGATR
ncbi:MAG: hypothetical protein ACT6FC_02170 [Methanosarcinaceae archaeon]